MRIIIPLSIAMFVLWRSEDAKAWDGVKQGLIAKIDVATDKANYPFRVYLSPGTEMCGTGTPIWSSLVTVSSVVGTTNYDASVSSITSAYMTGRQVVIYSQKNSSGLCEIGYFEILN